MPIFDQGYQHWEGQLSGHAWRWLAITRQGVRAQLRARGVRWVLLLSLMPALLLAGAMVVWGLVEQKSSLIMPLLALIQGLPEQLRDGPRQFRTQVWTLAFYFFFQNQLFFAMLLVVLIGPGLISQDLRFNALPLYFSRPLRRIDYFLGKLGVIAVFLGAVMLAPALLAYFLGVLFSFDLHVLADTARILLGSLAFGMVVILSAGTLMLALSSLSRNSRYVGAFWVMVWLVSASLMGFLIATVEADWCPLVSYTANLQRMASALLGTEGAFQEFVTLFRIPSDTPNIAPLTNPHPWYWSAAVLAALFGLSAWILSRRVRTLDRLK